MAAGKGDDTSRGSLSADSYGRTPLGDITNKMRVIGGGVEMQKDRKTSEGTRKRKEPYTKPTIEPLIIQKASGTML
jgi:hypothetical protein